MAALLATAFVGSFLASCVLTAMIRRVARRMGFVDKPGGHKSHQSPVALGGGIAITFSVCLPLLLVTIAASWAVRYGIPDWLPEFVRTHLPGVAFKAPGALAVVGGAVALHIVGLIDDVRPLGPAVKFAVQVGVAALLAGPFGIRILQIESWPAWVSVTATVFWIVVIVNAFNFLDNMDGLAAGVAIITGTILAFAGIGSGQIFVPTVMMMLVGALAAFLIFNFNPATIYMGDAGSLVVGYWMAVLIVLTTFYDPRRHVHPAGVFLPVVVLAVPLYDFVTVLIHRLLAGTSVFKGDQRHFSHRLRERGLSIKATVGTIYLATAATSLAATLLPGADWPTACVVFAQTLCVLAIIAILEHVKPSARQP